MAFGRYDPYYYYLGPNSWPVWVRKFLPYNRAFNYAAFCHDKFFSEGGGMKEFLRANRVFKTLCRASANTPGKWFGRVSTAIWWTSTGNTSSGGLSAFRFVITKKLKNHPCPIRN